MEYCKHCGRRIFLTKHGQFRKHNIRRGEVCPGSWEWPRKQRGAEHPTQLTPEQSGPYFWGCGNCGAVNWVTNDICANCKQARPERSGGS